MEKSRKKLLTENLNTKGFFVEKEQSFWPEVYFSSEFFPHLLRYLLQGILSKSGFKFNLFGYLKIWY
jgi:hypothetical protein